jgi:hypothetical protein
MAKFTARDPGTVKRMADGRLRHASTTPIEERVGDPAEMQKVAEVIDRVTDPWETLEQAAKDAGIPTSTASAIRRRMQTRYKSLPEQIKGVKTSQLLELIDDRLLRALNYMDDYALAGATARDLAFIVGVLADKRQILRGEPTQIFSNSEDRLRVNTAMEQLVAEAGRRGMIVELQPGEFTESEPTEDSEPDMVVARHDGPDPRGPRQVLTTGKKL